MYPHIPTINTTYHADANHCGGSRLTPTVIVLHHTGGEDSRKWLTTTSPPDHPVSVHILIQKDGTIYRLVDDHANAWHAGYGILGSANRSGKPYSVNTISLGIEIENMGNGHDPYPDDQLDACGYQIALWYQKYGFLSIVTHGLIDPRKNDPVGLPGQRLIAMVGRWWLQLSQTHLPCDAVTGE